MKTFKILNHIAIGTPLALAFAGIFNYLLIIWAIWSLVLTGAIQVLIGLCLLYRNPNDKLIISYIIGVVTFFGLWHLNVNIAYSEILSYCLFATPLILCIYLSYIVYSKKNLYES
jgi:hypothetical protein